MLEDERRFGVEQVKRILSKDIDTINPLYQIIEHDIYDSLDETNKEKYMIKLSKRYKEIKKQVLKEMKEVVSSC